MAEGDNRIQLEVVTPKGRALVEKVDEVSLPGEAGEFGVLPGHLPALAAARTGIVTYRVGNDTKKCAIGSGFVEVSADKVLVLTDEFVEKSAIDPVLVRKELAEVDQELTKLLQDSVDRTQPKEIARTTSLIARQNWLAAQLELFGDPPPATLRPYEEFGPPTAPSDDDSMADPGAAGAA